MLVEADLKDPVGQRELGRCLKPSLVCGTHYKINLLLCPKLQSRQGDEAYSSSHFMETPTGLEPAPFHGCVFDVLGSFDWLSFHCKSHQLRMRRFPPGQRSLQMLLVAVVDTQQLQ